MMDKAWCIELQWPPNEEREMVPGRGGGGGGMKAVGGVLFNVQPMSKWDTIFKKRRAGVEEAVQLGFEEEEGGVQVRTLAFC